jgi:predicted deacetylase
MDYGTFYRADDVLDHGRDFSADRIERADLGATRAMSIAIHDVAPATLARCERLVALAEQAGATPLTLLVVPRYHHQRPTPAFERWIEERLARGDELALHGLTHLDEIEPMHGWRDLVRRRWYTAGEGEFAAIGSKRACERLAAGRRWFSRRGWPVRGFVAPAWLLSEPAWSALHLHPFDYTCTLTRLVALSRSHRGERFLPGWSIVFSTRAGWRRRTSLAWNSVLSYQQQHAPWMRFELHPDDANHRGVMDALARWFDHACRGRERFTLGALAERIRAVKAASVS